jgi:MFS family permease
MLTSYRRILSVPGTALFSATGLVARLPISMVSLGIVLLVSAATGSYGLAGSVSAAYLLANGAIAIIQGRLLDSLGQGRVLTALILGFGASLGLLIWSVQADWPVLATYALAVVAGATLPSVGSCVRARWSQRGWRPRWSPESSGRCSSPPSGGPSRRRTPPAARPARGPRCRGRPWCRWPWSAPRSARSSAPRR